MTNNNPTTTTEAVALALQEIQWASENHNEKEQQFHLQKGLVLAMVAVALGLVT